MSIATLLPDGKIELPEEIRHFLHLQVGSQLSFTIAQDQVIVQTVCSTAHPAQLLARSYKPQRHNLVDEFIADRREEEAFKNYDDTMNELRQIISQPAKRQLLPPRLNTETFCFNRAEANER